MQRELFTDWKPGGGRYPRPMPAHPALTIRPATVADVKLLLRFIRSIAEYERLSHEVEATESRLRESLFGARPAAEALFAFWKGQPAAFAVFYRNFSTFQGRPGLYLEDLFVKPKFRRQGIGHELLLHVARLARDRGCGRFEWMALDWNEPAIRFYKKLGAGQLDEWTTFRMSRAELVRLAESQRGDGKMASFVAGKSSRSVPKSRSMPKKRIP